MKDDRNEIKKQCQNSRIQSSLSKEDEPDSERKFGQCHDILYAKYIDMAGCLTSVHGCLTSSSEQHRFYSSLCMTLLCGRQRKRSNTSKLLIRAPDRPMHRPSIGNTGNIKQASQPHAHRHTDGCNGGDVLYSQ